MRDEKSADSSSMLSYSSLIPPPSSLPLSCPSLFESDLTIQTLMADSTDTKPVRASEQLDWDTLSTFVREKLWAVLGEEFDARGPFAVEQFPGGHSNLTYLLRFGTQEFVMRR